MRFLFLMGGALVLGAMTAGCSSDDTPDAAAGTAGFSGTTNAGAAGSSGSNAGGTSAGGSNGGGTSGAGGTSGSSTGGSGTGGGGTAGSSAGTAGSQAGTAGISDGGASGASNGSSGAAGENGASGASSGTGGESGASGSGGMSGANGAGGAGQSGTAGTSANGTSGASGASGSPGGRDFPDGSWFYDDATNAAPVSSSTQITQWMVDHSGPNGWGTGYLKADFSISVVTVPNGTAKRTAEWDPDFYFPPDCDDAPIPVANGGAVEETYNDATDMNYPVDFSGPFTGYQCVGYDNGDDCHMLFRAPGEHRLYEIYHGTIRSNGTFQAGCLAIWDTSVVPPPTGRGDQCTSADAAGFPMIPMMFNADEIAAGHIDHAIRLILPNAMIRDDKYVRPASHGTKSTSGPATAPPYGAHFRLRANYPLDTLSPAARVVAAALQKYGMYVADGGNYALTAQSDLLTTHKWSEVGFDANSLTDLKATDFAIIDHGADILVTYDCTRDQITQ